MTTRARLVAAIAGVLLLGGAVAGCGGEATYCESLKQADDDFSALTQSDVGQIEDAFDAFHDLADKAPATVTDDWKLIDSAITGLEDAFDDAGLEFSDLSTPKPADESADKVAGVTAAMKRFSADDFVTALDNVGAHAKSNCRIDFN